MTCLAIGTYYWSCPIPFNYITSLLPTVNISGHITFVFLKKIKIKPVKTFLKKGKYITMERPFAYFNQLLAIMTKLW